MADLEHIRVVEKVEDHGWVHDCLIKQRPGEHGSMFAQSNGTIRPYLDGYAIIPIEEYDKLKAMEMIERK